MTPTATEQVCTRHLRVLAVLTFIGAAALAVLAAVSFTPIAHVLSGWISKPPRLEPAEAIVVLGAGGVRRNGTLSEPSLRRALHGIDLYRRGLAMTIVFTGSRNTSGVSEAAVRATLAREHGIPVTAVVIDTIARTTREEAEQVATLLRPRGISRILLVVDVEGVRRAAGVFERRGFAVLPAPVRDASSDDVGPGRRLILTRQVVVELLALAYYYAAGYL